MGLWRGLRGWMGLLGRASSLRLYLHSRSPFAKTLDIRYKLVETQ